MRRQETLAESIGRIGSLMPPMRLGIYEHPDFTSIDRLRHLMEEHSLTQAELARRTGIAMTSLSDILNGKRQISPTARAKLAACFGVSSAFFACGVVSLEELAVINPLFP